MSSGTDRYEVPERLKLMRHREDRNRRLIIAAIVIIAGVVLTIWGATTIDEYFDDYDQYQVDELPDLTVGLLLTIFGAIITTVAAIFLSSEFRT